MTNNWGILLKYHRNEKNSSCTKHKEITVRKLKQVEHLYCSLMSELLLYMDILMDLHSFLQ